MVGPRYDGSLIRSDAARPVAGFMLQRADQSPFETPWLSWIGRWQYQLSAGQLSQYSSVPHTKLIGARFTMMPTDFRSWVRRASCSGVARADHSPEFVLERR